MKNLLFVVAGAFIIMMSACGKGPSGVNEQNQSDTVSSKISLLAGTWYYTTDTVRFYTNSTLDSTETADYFQTDNIVFNNSGTGAETRAGVSSSFSFSVSGSNIDLTFATQPGGIIV